MTFHFRPAKREGIQLLIGLAGASSSGKTMSALKLARGLAGDKPFLILDTEARRALHYADHYQPWSHGEILPPFTPANYLAAVQAAGGGAYPVVIVDSVSHEHAGEGGLLDMHEAELERRAGNDWEKRERLTWGAWAKPKAEHRRFMNGLLQTRAHLILCFRAEHKEELVKDKQTGKSAMVPKRLLSGHEGWIPICEKNTLFELTLSLLLTPDAPGLPKVVKIEDDLKPFVPLDAPLSEQTGAALAAWAAGSEGEPQADHGRPASTPASTPGPSEASSPSVDLITEPQRKRLYSIASSRKIPKAEVVRIMREVAGVDTSTQLPRSLYDAVTAQVEAWEPQQSLTGAA